MVFVFLGIFAFIAGILILAVLSEDQTDNGVDRVTGRRLHR